MKNVYLPYSKVIDEIVATQPGFREVTDKQWADITTAHLYFTQLKEDITVDTLLPFASLYLVHATKVKFVVFAKNEVGSQSITFEELKHIVNELSLEELTQVAFAYKYRVSINSNHKYHDLFLKLFPAA